jgi:hypothetical protein
MLGVIGLLFLALLVDISINLRRVGVDLKKIAKSYDKVHGLDKA